MPIFHCKQNELTEITELNPKSYKEREIQQLAEHNLDKIFGLTFVRTEFELHGLRIDTLAFDDEAKAFVIIEYKRDRSFSVVDQGFAYLALMVNNKADFILEYNEHMSRALGKNDVDWSQSRVVFVANGFTNYQQMAINFRDLAMELWEAKCYSNDTILFNRLKTPGSTESIKTITRPNEAVEQVSKEIKKYTIDDHFDGARLGMRPLYDELYDQLTLLDNRLSANPRRNYIGMALGENGSNSVLYIHVQTDRLRIDIPRIRPEDVIDPVGLVKYKPHSLERYNTPVSQYTVNESGDIAYLIPIVREAIGRLGR